MISSMTEDSTARIIGAFFPSIRDRLLNALQIAKNAESDSAIYSAELIDESLKDFASEIQPLDFAQSVDTSRIPIFRRRLIITASISILIGCLFPASFSGAAYRLIHFTREFAPPSKYIFEISPGNKEIVKGDNVAIRIKVTSLLPSFTLRPTDITIYRQQEGQKNYDEIILKPDSSGIYHTIFQTLHISTEYFVRIADAESEHYKLTVLDRPLIRSFHVKLEYPSYTKIVPRTMDEFVGDITALTGTRATISGAASKSLKDAFIQFGNNTLLPLTISGEKFSASFSIIADNSYHISIIDEEGLSNSEPVQYQIKVVPDEYPTIGIIEPGRNIDIAGDQSLNLILQAKDDYGFSSIRLGYRLLKSRYEQTQAEYTFIPIPFSANAEVQIELPFNWNLNQS